MKHMKRHQSATGGRQRMDLIKTWIKPAIKAYLVVILVMKCTYFAALIASADNQSVTLL